MHPYWLNNIPCGQFLIVNSATYRYVCQTELFGYPSGYEKSANTVAANAGTHI